MEAENEVAPTEETGPFTEWDLNANDEITAAEFNQGFGNNQTFQSWDADGDGILSEEEFDTGLFSKWDEDQSGVLDEQEWQTGTDQWFGDAEYGTFADWDADGNSELTEDEFVNADYSLFSEWDADTNTEIGDSEFSEGVYGVWDENDDGALNEGEFTDAYEGWGMNMNQPIMDQPSTTPDQGAEQPGSSN